MGYGRLAKSEPGGSSGNPPQPTTSPPLQLPQRRSVNKKLVFLSILSIVLIAASAISAVFLIGIGSRPDGPDQRGKPLPTVANKPTQAISRACGRTRYPNLCVNSLVDFPGALAASEPDLVHISVNMTLQRLNKALDSAAGISFAAVDSLTRSAYDGCLELLEDSVDALSRALAAVASGRGGGPGESSDVVTWLSAALTNQDTCEEGFDRVNGGEVKGQVVGGLRDLSELLSNCLALFSGTVSGDFAGVPIGNRRRLLDSADSDSESGEFPSWMGKKERKLLGLPLSAIQADIVVSKDGNGSNGRYATIAQAIKKAPEHSDKRFIIYVMAGRYEEDNLKVGRKKTNLMFIGDGMGKTVISGGKSIFNNVTTFHTASFAATGAGFIARDLTFVNWAGPSKHQAVALRIGADHAVVYRCQVVGYQDTLYVHSNRQFFRESEVYGTVDFIFGNAAVVFQNCTIYARKPMNMQKNTITAQNRKDPNQNTGISIHACRIVAGADLESSKGSFPTYLGRPWKLYSRVVYMMSYMGDHVHPRGWLEWNATFALDSLYYGEYMNSGPGGAVGARIAWPGYRVITSTIEASKFTVAQFIYGSSWLPSTGVAFLAGLSV